MFVSCLRDTAVGLYFLTGSALPSASLNPSALMSLFSPKRINEPAKVTITGFVLNASLGLIKRLCSTIIRTVCRLDDVIKNREISYHPFWGGAICSLSKSLTQILNKEFQLVIINAQELRPGGDLKHPRGNILRIFSERALRSEAGEEVR